MSLIGLLILLVIAAIAGGLGQMLVGYSRGGCLVSILVGFIGAFIGQWLAGQFGWPEPLPVTVEGQTFPLVWAIVGAALFSGILNLLSRR
jgi:uncharacterized membrane protein YeaQ/YmgE (transglycosylase-associated protein family)